MTREEIRAAGAAWMRASLADRPADPAQVRRIRVLLAERPGERKAG